MSLIDGPSVLPLSGNQAKQLVIFCHGYGADGNDLIGLANYFQQALPDAFFISPNAPEACPMNPMGYQWFDFTSNDPELIWKKVNDAGEILNKFIDHKLNELNLTDENLSLVGFSQGTMMSLHVGLRRKLKMSSIVGFSGRLIREDTLADEIRSRPPIYLIHGDQDEVVNPTNLLEAKDFFVRNNIPIETKMIKNCGHHIAVEASSLALNFIKKNLKFNKI